MIENFGKTTLFIFLIVILLLGVQMALKVSVPIIRPVSGSLAAAIESTL